MTVLTVSADIQIKDILGFLTKQQRDFERLNGFQITLDNLWRTKHHWKARFVLLEPA